MRDSEIPNYYENIRNMSDIQNNWMSKSFKYDLNDGYNTLSMDLLDWIFPNYKDFTGFQLNPDDLLDFGSIETNDIVWDNSGPVGLIIVALILSIFMLIAGIGWCIIKFCCCCLRKNNDIDSILSEDDEDKRGKYARIGCGIGLGVWILLYSFGLFGCFVANEQIRTAMKDLGKDIDHGLHDAELYLNITKEQLHFIFVTNYDKFSTAVLSSIEDDGRENYGLIDNSKIIDKFIYDLNNVENIVQKLNSNFELTENSLDKSKINILNIFKTCNTEFCQNVHDTNLKEIKMDSTYENLKMNIKTTISKTINNGLEMAKFSQKNDIIKEWLDSTGRSLEDDSKRMTDALSDVPIPKIRQDIEDIDENMEDWFSYFYYTLLVVCIFLLLTPVVLIIGTIFGCFGKRSHAKKFGTRRTGGTFLNCGIFSMFLVGWVLWILAMAAFIFSGLLTQIICEAVRELENLNSTKSTTSPSTPGGVYDLPSYGQIVEHCKNGNGAYSTFELEQVYDASEILGLVDEFPNIDNLVQDIVFKRTNKMTNFKNQWTLIKDELKTNEESLGPNIIDISTLKNIIKNSSTIQIIHKLDSEIQKIEKYENIYKELIQNDIKLLDEQMEEISEQVLNMIDSTFTNKIERINVQEVGNASVQVERYVDFVYNEIFRLGDCEPLYKALDTTIDIFCYKIAAPVSSFWFGLTIMLLIFIPLIITSILLEKLYKRQ